MASATDPLCKIQWLRDAQSLMTSMASNYNMPRLYQGIALTLIAIVASGVAFHISRAISEPEASAVPFVLTTAAYGTMMFASSYVEEEHHFWYWACTLYLAYLGTRRIAPPIARTEGAAKKEMKTTMLNTGHVLLALLVLRVLRGWNQTGQKYAGQPDLLKTYLIPNPSLLWSLIMCEYFHVLIRMFRHLSDLLKSKLLAGLWTLLITPVALGFKMAFTAQDAPEISPYSRLDARLISHVAKGLLEMSLAQRAQLVFIAVGFLFFFAMHAMLSEPLPSKRRSAFLLVTDCAELLVVTQSRTANVPLILAMRFLEMYLSQWAKVPLLDGSPMTWFPVGRVEGTLAGLTLEMAGFFAFGGTNAISSVDLSNAYNGIREFNVGAVGVLIFVGNWGPSILWALWGVQWQLERCWARDDVEVLHKASCGLARMKRDEKNEEKEKAKEKATGEKDAGGATANESTATQGGKVGAEEGGDTDSSEKAKPGAKPFSKTTPEEQLEVELERLGERLSLVWTTHIAMLTLFTACSLGAVMAACTVLRTHLFIWTVFSPRYLYSMAWCLGQHLIVRVVLCGGLWWAACH